MNRRVRHAVLVACIALLMSPGRAQEGSCEIDASYDGAIYLTHAMLQDVGTVLADRWDSLTAEGRYDAAALQALGTFLDGNLNSMQSHSVSVLRIDLIGKHAEFMPAQANNGRMLQLAWNGETSCAIAQFCSDYITGRTEFQDRLISMELSTTSVEDGFSSVVWVNENDLLPSSAITTITPAFLNLVDERPRDLVALRERDAEKAGLIQSFVDGARVESEHWLPQIELWSVNGGRWNDLIHPMDTPREPELRFHRNDLDRRWLDAELDTGSRGLVSLPAGLNERAEFARRLSDLLPGARRDG